MGYPVYFVHLNVLIKWTKKLAVKSIYLGYQKILKLMAIGSTTLVIPDNFFSIFENMTNQSKYIRNFVEHHVNKICIVLVPYMDSALNMDTPNIFKGNKFYRHMALRARKEKHYKR